jgi:outer membrane biosynthesis protein TonB
MLDAQAAKAAKEFEFRPAQQNGAPIPVIVRIQIAFNLREKK